jgi:hypothetical protein
MKALGYLLLLLGAIALISIFFGYTHQWLMALIGLGLGKAILSESRRDDAARKI